MRGPPQTKSKINKDFKILDSSISKLYLIISKFQNHLEMNLIIE